MQGRYTVVIDSEAFERLCAIRDMLTEVTSQEQTLSAVLSSLLLQIPVEGVE